MHGYKKRQRFNRKNFKRLIEKKILIVGGTGFIGRELIKRCLDFKVESNEYFYKECKA